MGRQKVESPRGHAAGHDINIDSDAAGVSVDTLSGGIQIGDVHGNVTIVMVQSRDTAWGQLLAALSGKERELDSHEGDQKCPTD